MVNGVAGQTGLLAVSHAGMVQGRGPECVIIQHLCMMGTIAQDTHLKTKCVVLGDAYLVRMVFRVSEVLISLLGNWRRGSVE